MDIRRWDPVSETISSVLATVTGMIYASSGILLKPADTYMRSRSRSRQRCGSHDMPRSPSTSRQSPTSLIMPIDFPEASRSLESTNALSTLSPSIHSAPELLSDKEAVPNRISSSEKPNVAGEMAIASAKSFGRFLKLYTKGIIVDVPLATTEGFRNMPVLWGSDRKDYGTVTDWKSGGVVAGRNLVQGLADGFYDVAMEPIKGARKEGTWGAVKGVAKGSASLVTKAASGSLGLLAYPGQGISKSLYDVIHSSTNAGDGGAVQTGVRSSNQPNPDLAPSTYHTSTKTRPYQPK